MKLNQWILLGSLGVSIVAIQTPLLAQVGEGAADVREDRGDLRQDRRDIRGDRRDIRGDRRDLRGDRQDLRRDIRSGAGRGKLRRTVVMYDKTGAICVKIIGISGRIGKTGAKTVEIFVTTWPAAEAPRVKPS